MSTKKYLSLDGLSHLWLLITNKLSTKVDKAYKTGSQSELKVLSDNNLTDELLQKINDSGSSSFSGSWNDLTDVPTDLVEDANYTHTDNNYTTPEKNKLNGVAANAQVNILEGVQVNGTDLTITGKKVNVSVPTNNNQLTNGAGYQTAAEVQTAINAAVSSAYKYKGSVASYSALPSSGQSVGDVYNVEAADSTHGIKAGDNVAWTGTTWDVLAGMLDLSGYLKDTDVIALTNAEIDSVCV